MIQDTITSTTSTLIVREVFAKWFNLPPEFIPLSERYYLLHWTGSYLAEKIIADSPDLYNFPSLEHQGITYQVVFIHPKSETKLTPTAKYAISFRKLPETAKGFALIKQLGISL